VRTSYLTCNQLWSEVSNLSNYWQYLVHPMRYKLPTNRQFLTYLW
jgi:hypothetical protein